MPAPKETVTANVAVVGGGIAGAWAAYRLAGLGVPTVLVRADEQLPPLSRTWASGAVRRTVVDGTTAMSWTFADRSTTQHPDYRGLMADRAIAEYADYAALVGYRVGDERFVRPVGAGDGRRDAGADGAVRRVLAGYLKLGGRLVEGRVTDFVVDGDTCLGLRYERAGVPGRIRCADVVLASGGFCGLFPDGVGHSPGHLIGTYARNGGSLANLELFNRFAIGDLDRRRPIDLFDLPGEAVLRRAGAPAEELDELLAACAGDHRDIEVFARYWVRNLSVPHTVELPEGTFRVWPVRGFAMGGVAPTLPTASSPRNIHATGECAYGLSLDSVTGKPFVSFLAAGAELAARLADRSAPSWSPEDFEPGPVISPLDPALRDEVGRLLLSFQDTRFSVRLAECFLTWCVDERRRRKGARPLDLASFDLLILAEAFTRSVLARRESRGFFYRPDFPATDHSLDGRTTLATYDADRDEVRVRWSLVGAPSPRVVSRGRTGPPDQRGGAAISSRSTRRSTLPVGERGIAVTGTTRRSRA